MMKKEKEEKEEEWRRGRRGRGEEEGGRESKVPKVRNR